MAELFAFYHRIKVFRPSDAVYYLSVVLLNGVLAIGLLQTSPAYALGEELLEAETILSTQDNDEAGSDSSLDADSDAETDSQTANSETPTVGNLTEKDTVIETNPENSNDDDIQKRISGIFSEIDGLDMINISVNEGVVSLSGDAPNEKKARQAVNLATRVSEVVAVDDKINRTLDVQDNVTPVISGLQQQGRGLIKAIPLMLVAFLVFGLVTWLGRFIAGRDSIWQRITPNPFVAELLSQTIKVIFIIIGLILALSLMGAEAIIGTLLGGAGVFGIAVGFAVKDTIENYIASLMLSMRQPFRARDQVDINGQRGIVVRLTSRATILMTADGNQLRIPNAEVFKATILNYTKNPERRFTFELGVDANDDPIAAIKVGLDAINELAFVLQEPKAIAIITQVGDSNIILEFQVWVNQDETDYFKARSIAIREAKHALENSGFSLPEPIYRLRFNGDVEEAIKHFSPPNNNFSNKTTSTPQVHTSEPDATEPSASTPADFHITVTPSIPSDTEASTTEKIDTSLDTNSETSPDISSYITGNANNTNIDADTAADTTKNTDIPHADDPQSTRVRPIASTQTLNNEKIEAKKRARQILGDKDVEDILDARPDPKLMEKVEEEIKENTGDKDLLNYNSPQE